MLALSACRGAKKVEDGEELGSAQLHFFQQLADMLFSSIDQIVNGKQNFTALDGSSLLFNYVIFLDLLSGSPASRLVLTHPRWLPILSTLAKTPNVPMQFSVLRILRRVLPQHTVAAPAVAVSTATGGSFKSAISAAFSGVVPKGAAADTSAQKEKDDAMSVCRELLTLAGRNLST